MNAIVVDASQEEPLPKYRSRVRRFIKKDPNVGWGYDPFSGMVDLVPSITIAKGNNDATIVEIVAHGSPTYHHDIGGVSVAPFAAELRKLLTTTQNSSVYLTGCNTGLSEGGYCIAEELARALEGVSVFGAAGFVMDGAAITENAETAAEFEGQRYTGARDSIHDACWNEFFFAPSEALVPSSARMRPKPNPEIDPDVLREAIAEALRAKRRRSVPPLLVGPDLRGVIDLETGPFAYELLLRASILRNAISREAFEFPRGPELLDRALRNAR